MASLFKRPRSPYFWGSFRDSKGVWQRKSTGEADEAAAQKVLDGWNRAATASISSPDQARQVLLEILKPHLGTDAGILTTKAYVERWLKQVAVRKSTLDFYRSTLTCFLRALGSKADAPILALGKMDIVEWRNAEITRVRARTVTHRLKAVRMMLAAAVSEGYALQNVAKDVKPPVTNPDEQQEEKNRRPFTFAELQRLESVMPDEWKTILWLGFYTGQRFGDILRFRWEDVDLPGCQLQLLTRKKGKRIWQPIAPALLEKLLLWRNQQNHGEKYLFPSQVAQLTKSKGKVGRLSNRFAHFLWLADLRSQSPFTRSRQAERARKAAIAAGQPPTDHTRKQQELCFHSLRHTARTILEESGTPKSVIDAFIGHAGSTGANYTHVGREALQRAAHALSDGFANSGKRKRSPLKVLPAPVTVTA
jgi:integrase